MSLPKLVGLETEYALVVPQTGEAREGAAAGVVAACDVPQVALAQDDLMLANGARFYVDMGHPEYSTPECLTALELVACDKAGELVVARAAERFGSEALVYKNNSDHHGHSYGCHENYLVSARCFGDLFGRKMHLLFSGLLPFLVTRQIYAGAGKVGAENGTEPVDYQLSQRADFMETVIGLATTERRPLINTRDEPHADARRFRRLHVTCGDANMSEFATFLKVGALQLVLAMIEDEALESDLVLADPVAAVCAVSRDLTGQRPVPLANGKERSAWYIQARFLRWARQYLRDRGEDPRRNRVIRSWAATLWCLKRNPARLADRLDWMIKLRLLEHLRQREHLGWDSPRLQELDIKYHGLHRERSPFHRLQAAGAVVRLVPDKQITRLAAAPPKTTRAYVRGRSVARFAGHIHSMDWERLEFDGGSLELPDPQGAPVETVREWLAGAKRPEELLARATASAQQGDRQ